MSIAIISAQTGHGHASVMNALKEEFYSRGVSDINIYPSFYEDMMLCNKILSNFYNYLMMNCISLCNKYCEFTYLTRYDLSDDFYNGVKDKVIDFLMKNNFDTIISVSHTINHVMIRIIKELNINTKYFIVITDPYSPIAVGYDIPGADKYFCATETVKNILLKNKIPENKVKVTGYPVDKKFLECKKDHNMVKYELNFKKDKKIILINSSAVGIYYYYEFLKIICDSCDCNIIFICGNNLILYNQCVKYVKCNELEDNVRVLPFIKNMQDYLNIADIVITKAGANTVYEAIAMKTPLLIDATDGLIFQERGIEDFLKKNKIGMIFWNKSQLIEEINTLLSDKNYYDNINVYNLTNGVTNIVEDVLNNSI